jgi:hypothetical protein
MHNVHQKYYSLTPCPARRPCHTKQEFQYVDTLPITPRIPLSLSLSLPHSQLALTPLSLSLSLSLSFVVVIDLQSRTRRAGSPCRPRTRTTSRSARFLSLSLFLLRSLPPSLPPFLSLSLSFYLAHAPPLPLARSKSFSSPSLEALSLSPSLVRSRRSLFLSRRGPVRFDKSRGFLFSSVRQKSRIKLSRDGIPQRDNGIAGPLHRIPGPAAQHVLRSNPEHGFVESEGVRGELRRRSCREV